MPLASSPLAARTIAAALVEIDPGGMPEIHWHPNADEGQYYLEGQARMTVFAATGLARTFDYQAGDVGIAPVNTAHDIENRGDTPLRLLAIFRSDHYADVSLNQWLALIPPELVREHLHLSDHTLAALSKQKRLIVKERDQSIWGTLRIPSTRSFAARYAVSCPPHRPNTAPRVSEVHPGYTYR